MWVVTRHGERFRVLCMSGHCTWQAIRDTRAEADAEGKRHRWELHLSGGVAR